jgi:glycosyltransferase involved in cell wall biosynthesis
MRVMLVAPPWYTIPPTGYGGIEVVVALLSSELVSRGHDVVVVASGESTCAGRIRSPLPVPPPPAVLGDPWIEGFHALMAYQDIDHIDVIHDHGGAFGPALASVITDRPPVVHTLHGPWTPETRAFYRLVDDRVHLVAVSDSQRRDDPGVSYAATVHNGISLDDHPMGNEARGSELVYIGRANPDKNPGGAIRVARAAGRPLRMIVKRHEPAEQAYWNREVAPLLGADVEVMENVSHEQKVEVLQRAHAMVFPINWPEPFGLVMVEAMACGTPVLACPVGAATEVIADGRSGFLCNGEEDMAAKVAAVDDLDRSLCRKWVTERFSAESMTDGSEAVYNHVTSRG